MAFMFTDLGGVIRIGKYTPEGSIPLGKGKEWQLTSVRDMLGEFVHADAWRVPGFETITSSIIDTRDERLNAISVFRLKVEAMIRDGVR